MPLKILISFLHTHCTDLHWFHEAKMHNNDDWHLERSLNTAIGQVMSKFTVNNIRSHQIQWITRVSKCSIFCNQLKSTKQSMKINSIPHFECLCECSYVLSQDELLVWNFRACSWFLISLRDVTQIHCPMEWRHTHNHMHMHMDTHSYKLSCRHVYVCACVRLWNCFASHIRQYIDTLNVDDQCRHYVLSSSQQPQAIESTSWFYDEISFA